MRRDMTLNLRKPYVFICILAAIIVLCVLAGVLAPYEAASSDSGAINAPPGGGHVFGTDSLGRDLWSMILYGGRDSLVIGLLATGISTLIAFVYGTASGLAPRWLDDIMMRFAELLMSVPSILLIIFIQAILGTPTVLSISVVIGITGWMNIAKVVRSEVRQIRKKEYVLAARMMGGGFMYILRRHLVPSYISATMFMIVSNIGSAIAMEASLSFLGLGLPLTKISWGSLMSMSQGALLTGSWWIVVLPGVFLVLTVFCITEIGEYVRIRNNMNAGYN